MVQTNDEASIPDPALTPETASGQKGATDWHQQGLEVELGYVPGPDAAQRLTQAYEMLFNKTGRNS